MRFRKEFFIIIILVFLFTLLRYPPNVAISDDLFRPRIVVIPIVNSQENEKYNAICLTITDTVILTLKLINKYELIKPPDIDPYKDIKKLRVYLERNSVDYAIFGMVYRDEEDSVAFELSVYDKVGNRVEITKIEKIKDIFEIFDASDRLVSSVIESFSGIHIGFGKIIFRNEGEKGKYLVYLNNVFMGEDIKELDKVLNGKYICEIKQRRMLGERTVFKENIVVYENKKCDVNFFIPYLMNDERKILDDLDLVIKRSFNSKNEVHLVESAFEKILKLLRYTPYSPRLKDKWEKYRQLNAEYKLKVLKWRIEESFYEEPDEIFNQILFYYKNAYEFPEPGTIRSMAKRNAELLCALLRIEAESFLVDKEWESAIEIYDQIRSYVSRVSFDYFSQFQEDERFIKKIYNSYKILRNKSKRLSDKYLQSTLSLYFGSRLDKSWEIMKSYKERNKKIDLIIITNPLGMNVTLNRKNYGTTPLYINDFNQAQVKIDVNDEWFLIEGEFTYNLNEGKNVILLPAAVNKLENKISANTAIFINKGRYRLSWNRIPESLYYLVEIEEKSAEGSIYKLISVKNTKTELIKKSKNLKPKSYRVCGVNNNHIKSPWSDKAGFERQILWSYKVNGTINFPPAVDLDGTVYLGDNKGNLYAFNSDATVRWVVKLGDYLSSQPIIDKNDNIYVISNKNTLYAIDKNGFIKWKFVIDSSIYSAPAIDDKGNIYVGCGNNYLYAISYKGELLWKYDLKSPIYGSPVIADDAIYVATSTGDFFVMYKSGKVKLKLKIYNPVVFSPVVDRNGTIFICSNNGIIISIGEEGKEYWRLKIGKEIVTQPVLDNTGCIVIATRDKLILVQNGKIKNTYRLYSPLGTVPLVTENNDIFIGLKDGAFNLLKNDKKLKNKWFLNLDSSISSNSALSDSGILYVTTILGGVYAIPVLSKYPANSGWPMLYGNPRNTGNLNDNVKYINADGSIAIKNIKVDGKCFDWFDIQPILVDKEGDTKGNKHTDLKAAYVAKDDKYFYAMFSCYYPPFMKYVNRSNGDKSILEVNFSFYKEEIPFIFLHTNMRADNTIGIWADKRATKTISIPGVEVRWGDVIEIRFPRKGVLKECTDFKIQFVNFWKNRSTYVDIM